MTTIVTRSGKGTPLTNAEVDANFTNLDADKLESGDTVASLTLTSADINGGTIDGTVIGGSTPAAGTFSSVTVNGNITVTGTVDGRDVAADGSKLDGIEANAKDDQTINAGAGLTGGGTGDVTISHADTSAQASVNNSGATVIQDVTLDTYGHVTGLGSATLGLSDFGVTATSSELNVLDGITATTDNLNATQFLTGRNKIINGNFDIWQRGTSATGPVYLADRWVHNVAGSSGTVTQSRQAFTPGQTDVPNEPTYFYRIQGSSYTFNAANITQRIEDVRTFAGQTVTVSFYAKASAARQIRVRLDQAFDGSAIVSAYSSSALSLTTSWQKFTATIAVPSISGKTVGPNSRLELVFEIKEGAFGSDLGSDSIDIAQVQLEAGDVATPFEVRSIGQELSLCQRYYAIGPNFAFNASRFDNFFFPIPMRVTPILTVTTAIAGSYITSPQVSPYGFYANYSLTTGISYTADAEL